MLKGWSNVVTFSCIVIAAVVEAGQQALKDAPNVAALFPRWASGSFWNYVPLLLLTMGGIAWLVGRVAPSAFPKLQPIEDWRAAFRKPQWEILTGHVFANKTIEVDGKSFRDCKFENVTWMFRGRAPVDFGGVTQVCGGFSIDTDDPAIMLYSKLQRFARSIPGATIQEGPIDDKGNILVENFGIKPLVLTAERADVLRSLPVYPQDLHVKLISSQIGTTLNLDEFALFFKLSLVSDDDTGLREMTIWVDLGTRTYSAAPLEDLSNWIIRTPFKDARYPYKSFEDKSLETVSLWRDVQHGGVKSGLVNTGWVGVHIPDANFTDRAVRVRIEVTKVNPRRTYTFRFSQCPESEEKIFDIAFKQLS